MALIVLQMGWIIESIAENSLYQQKYNRKEQIEEWEKDKQIIR